MAAATGTSILPSKQQSLLKVVVGCAVGKSSMGTLCLATVHALFGCGGDVFAADMISAGGVYVFCETVILV